MIVFAVFFFLSLVSCFFCVVQIIKTGLLLKKLNKTDFSKISFCRKIIKTKKKEIIKIKKQLARKTIRRNFQSVPFCAKFLYEKEYLKTSVGKKFLINNLFKKLQNNVCQFSTEINFDKLKNSGLFNNKPIMLFSTPKTKRQLINLKYCLKELNKHVNFSPIFILESLPKDNSFEDFQYLIFQDVNINLLFELNKINLNYNVNFNKQTKTPSADYISTCNVNINRIIDNLGENETALSYKISSIESGKISLFIKLKSLFLNLKKSEDYFELQYADGSKIKYFSNFKIKEFQILNRNFQPYLKLEFNIKKNENLFLSCFENQSYKNKLIKEKFVLENLFKIKIYTKNKEFNNFFNYVLPKNIIEEIYQYNNFNKQKIYYNKIFLRNFLNIDYKELVLNSSSYFKLYDYLVKNVFGINLKGEKLFLFPKVLFDFKISTCSKTIYVRPNGEKTLNIGEVVYSNVSFIDLNLLNKPAVMCI